MPINEDIADDLLRRTIRYARYENALWREVEALLRQVERDLIERIESGVGRTLKAQRTEAVLAAVRRIIAGGEKQFFEKLRLDGIELINIETGAAIESFRSATISGGISWVAPSKALLRAAVTEKPFEGRLLSDWVSAWSERTRRLTEAQIRIGIVEGEGEETIVRRLRGTRANGYRDGVLESSRREAKALTRTYTSHITNAARAEIYEQNKDVLAGEQWLATLDHRTCPICGALDLKVFDVGKGPRAPAHVNCRCVRVPLTKLDAALQAKGLEPISKTRTARGPDGKTIDVPSKWSFSEWLRRQSEETQDDVLGKKRADLFRSGTNFDKFVNDENIIIPLRDL